MTNWGAAVPIVVAIIAVVGTSILAPAFNSNIFSPQLNNKPILNTDIGPEPKPARTVFYLTNNGTVPATNLSLVLILTKLYNYV